MRSHSPSSTCLLTNDDGPGLLLRPTQQILQPLFDKVVTVIPNGDRIATSAALSRDAFGMHFDRALRAWLITGFPADGVRYALQHMVNPLPDFVVSGINNGYNLGRTIVNSGTIGAAMEAARVGVPAICISTDRCAGATEEWMRVVRAAISKCVAVLRHIRPGSSVLSVNVPGVLRDHPRVVYLPVSQVCFDERYEETHSKQGRLIFRNGEILCEDRAIPDIRLLEGGHMVLNLLTTPWTVRQPELVRILQHRFPLHKGDLDG